MIFIDLFAHFIELPQPPLFHSLFEGCVTNLIQMCMRLGTKLLPFSRIKARFAYQIASVVTSPSHFHSHLVFDSTDHPICIQRSTTNG